MNYGKSNTLTLTWLAAAALIPVVASAQRTEKLSVKYIPDDAIVAAFVSPSQIMSSPEWELMPTEVIQAAGLEYVGIDPMDIEGVKVVVAVPDPTGPRAGAVVKFSKDVRIGDLKPAILKEFDQQDFDGVTVYESRERPFVRLHQPESRTIVLSLGEYLRPMLDASEGGTGQLPQLAGKLAPRSGITVIAVFDQVRPMITGLLRQNAVQLPEPLRDLAEFGELTDALLVNVNSGLASGSLSVSALGRDEASAIRLEKVLNDTIDFGREMLGAEMMKSVEGEGPVNEAMGRYIERLGGQLSAMIRPTRRGKVVQIEIANDGGVGSVGTAGVMVGLLLPAVQAAREAARRMTASNNLRQIGLAIHNYHATYNKLPDRAIRDPDGKPLLSWRVAILPFLEQKALHDQFRLDQPWDSPHNLALLEQMPEAYVDPSAVVPVGHTVFQLSQGEGLMFEDTGERTFRDVLDGLSNTIMAVESSREASVPWTKPADLEFEPSNRLADTGNAHQGGFHVLMADGAVIFLANSIDPDLFKALLTRAGQEPVNGPPRP